MKTLKDYLKECIGGIFATPATTTGLGNPIAPDTTNLGSGDMLLPLDTTEVIQLKPIKKDKKKTKKHINKMRK